MPDSSAPSGTSSASMFGIRLSASSSAPPSPLSSAAICSFSALPSANSGAMSRPSFLAAGMDLAISLARACNACTCVLPPRSSASRRCNSAISISSPRRLSAALNASGCLRISSLSCIGFVPLVAPLLDCTAGDNRQFVKPVERNEKQDLA